MRICQLNPYYFPYAGGIERRMRELSRRLARRHEVFVLTSQLPGSEQDEDENGVHVRRLPSRYWFRRYWNPPVVSTPKVLEAMRQIRPDVVDYHYRWAPAYARAFLAAHEFSRLVFTYHNTYGEGTGALRWASLANDWWTKRFIRRADRIVCISPFIRDDLERRGFPPDGLRVVPNGVDAEALHEAARGGHRPAGVPDVFIMAVGRLVPTKGFDLLVRALRSLPISVHAVICGEGPDRRRLERVAESWRVRHRLHLLGWVPEADKLRLLQECLAYVHPARFESFGMAVLEAMAMGAPVVAARVGGLVDLVGESGILVDAENADQVAAAVHGLLREDGRRKDLGRRSRARAAELSWDRAAASIERLYDEALQAPLAAGAEEPDPPSIPK